jgi:lysyl-tRNA synthetase class 2
MSDDQSQPESSDVHAERTRILAQAVAAGHDPYPASTDQTHTIAAFLEQFESLGESISVTLVGRVMATREHGAIAFFDIFDGTGRTQAFLSVEAMGQEAFDACLSYVSTADFIQVTGTPFLNKRGKQVVLVTDWRLLTKATANMPTEHFGIKDEDERLRKRYLDLLLSDEQRELFVQKAKFWDVTRTFMKERGFLEVETPYFETTTGGAEARPFITHHNDFGIDGYLRISVGELWQKRLMAAGFPKTFEIGKVFRNEGTSSEHLQEFTNMEFYWAYADYRDGMTLTRDLYITIAQEVFGTTQFEVRGHSFDLADEWREIHYVSEVLAQTGIDVTSASEDEMKTKLNELGVQYDGDNRERLTDTLWKYCRKHIAGPAFLVNHPLLVAPLAKANADGLTAQMFQPIIAGSEVGRGYSELNDPDEQRRRFEVQQQLLDAGDDEAMMPDWEFVEMLEHGMPPTCGFGFGERLFAFLAGKSLRETQLFPLVKPK